MTDQDDVPQRPVLLCMYLLIQTLGVHTALKHSGNELYQDVLTVEVSSVTYLTCGVLCTSDTAGRVPQEEKGAIHASHHRAWAHSSP